MFASRPLGRLMGMSSTMPQTRIGPPTRCASITPVTYSPWSMPAGFLRSHGPSFLVSFDRFVLHSSFFIMSRTIWAEFAVEVPDDCDLMATIASMKVSIIGDNVQGWQLSEVCDDDGPLVSNFLR
jgi:hypothetical protein